MSFNGTFKTPLRPRRSHTATGTGAGLLVVVMLFGVACLNGWLLMLAIGVLSSHSVLGGTLPFWDSVFTAFLLTALFATSANTKVGKS